MVLADGVGPAQRTARRSGPSSDVGAPVFNDRLTFSPQERPVALRVRVFAHRRLRASELIGEATLPLPASGEIAPVQWVALAGPGSRDGAAVQLSVKLEEVDGRGGDAAAAARLETASRVGLATLRIDSIAGLAPGPRASAVLGAAALRAGAYSLRLIFGHGLRRFHARPVAAPPLASVPSAGASSAVVEGGSGGSGAPVAQTLQLWLREGEQEFLLSCDLFAEVPDAKKRGGRRLVLLGRGWAPLAEIVDALAVQSFEVVLREVKTGGEGLTDADEHSLSALSDLPTRPEADGSGVADAPEVTEEEEAAAALDPVDGSGVRSADVHFGSRNLLASASAPASAAVAAVGDSAAAESAAAAPPLLQEPASVLVYGREANESSAGPIVGSLRIRGEYHPRATVERDFYARLLSCFDMDGNGSLDNVELVAMLSALGAGGGGRSQGISGSGGAADVEALAATLPTNSEGEFDSAGLLAWLASPAFQALPMSYSLLAFLADGEDGHRALVNDVTSAVSRAARRTHAGAAVLALDEGDRTVLAVSGLKIFDRKSGLIVTEHIPSFVHTALNLMYRSSLGSRLVNTTAVRRVLAKLSASEGRTMDSPASAARIAGFIAEHKINMAEAKLESPSDYPTFNAFFTRELKAGARPIAAPDDDGVVISPADSRAVVFPTVAAAAELWIKGRTFTVEALLGPACADVAQLFAGGAVLLSRLAPQDYHRWHMPVSGRLARRAHIDGALYTVSPIAIRRAVPDVFIANKREVTLVHTRDFGLVAIVAVGATVVGSINIVLPDGSYAKRGDCHGYFAFGGSTVLTLFQPGAVTFDSDLLRNSATPLETYVRMGERVGIAASRGIELPLALPATDVDHIRHHAQVA